MVPQGEAWVAAVSRSSALPIFLSSVFRSFGLREDPFQLTAIRLTWAVFWGESMRKADNSARQLSLEAISAHPLFEMKLVTYTQARELLSCSERHLRDLISSGAIKPVWIGKGVKGKRIRAAALVRFINEREAS